MDEIPGDFLFHLFFIPIDFYRPQRSWGKVIFLHLFVILFTGGGGVRGCSRGGGACVVAPGGGMRGIRQDTEIWSMSGWYASYWNAFLFIHICWYI